MFDGITIVEIILMVVLVVFIVVAILIDHRNIIRSKRTKENVRDEIRNKLKKEK